MSRSKHRPITQLGRTTTLRLEGLGATAFYLDSLKPDVREKLEATMGEFLNVIEEAFENHRNFVDNLDIAHGKLGELKHILRNPEHQGK